MTYYSPLDKQFTDRKLKPIISSRFCCILTDINEDILQKDATTAESEMISELKRTWIVKVGKGQL